MPVKQRFSKTKEIERSQIMVKPEIFQGRQVAFAQSSVNKIVREGFDKSQDPIIVWKEKGAKKYIVISGHSRWEASKILYKEGDKTLKKMPAKVFLGNKDEAINYAVLESNRSGASEGLISDVKAYKIAVKNGYNRNQLLSLFRPDSYLRFLQDLSFLNIKGRFVGELVKPSAKSFPFLKRNSQWVGTLRKIYPQLTNSHENELFDYFYKKKKGKTGINNSKIQIFEMVEKRVLSLDFNKSKPLNLNNIASTSALTKDIDIEIKLIDLRIKKLESERKKRQNYLIRAKRENNKEREKKFLKDLEVNQRLILAELTKKERFETGKRKLKRVSVDIFNQAPVKRKTSTKPKTTKATAKNSRKKPVSSPPLRRRARVVKENALVTQGDVTIMKKENTIILSERRKELRERKSYFRKTKVRSKGTFSKDLKDFLNLIKDEIEIADQFNISNNNKRRENEIYSLFRLKKIGRILGFNIATMLDLVFDYDYTSKFLKKAGFNPKKHLFNYSLNIPMGIYSPDEKFLNTQPKRIAPVKKKTIIIKESVKKQVSHKRRGNKKVLDKINARATQIQVSGGRKADKKVKGAYVISRTTAVSRASRELKRIEGLIAKHKRANAKKAALKPKSRRNSRRVTSRTKRR